MTIEVFALSPEEQTILDSANESLAAAQETLVRAAQEALRAAVFFNRYTLSPDRLDEMGREEVLAFWRFLAEPDTTVVEERGAQCAAEGLGLRSVLALRVALEQACWEVLPTHTESDRQRLQTLLKAVGAYLAAFWAGFWAASEQSILDEQERIREALDTTLREQWEQEVRLQRTISELSSPVIQVWEGVLVLPLVGAIDSERARRMTEDLLNGIVARQAEHVIIDITGVPVVDTRVANHLLQTIKAARLLGARCLLVGISSEVAQAMVHLGIDLSGIATRANLQVGIEYVMAQMGLGVAPLGPEA